MDLKGHCKKLKKTTDINVKRFHLSITMSCLKAISDPDRFIDAECGKQAERQKHQKTNRGRTSMLCKYL